MQSETQKSTFLGVKWLKTFSANVIMVSADAGEVH